MIKSVVNKKNKVQFSYISQLSSVYWLKTDKKDYTIILLSALVNENFDILDKKLIPLRVRSTNSPLVQLSKYATIRH